MKKRRDSGFTLLEIMIALAILVIAIIGLISVITYTTRANQVNRENMIAMRAAEAKIEEMQQFPTGEIYSRYNSSTGDDSLFPGLHPGPGPYTVAGLTNSQLFITFAGDIISSSGTITYAANLVENTTDPDIIARDLNANGVIGETVNTTYVLLPTTITLTWKSIQGNRTLSYKTLFLKKT